MCCFFFFQAEDGIRDLVRSRGLGDVYKRQVGGFAGIQLCAQDGEILVGWDDLVVDVDAGLFLEPVSYTHLTLPTSDLV